MDQLTFVLLTSAMALMMFAFGWVAGAVHQRLKRGSAPESQAVERLAGELAAAERERDECISSLEDQRRATAETLAERDESHHRIVDQLRDAEQRLNRLNDTS